MQVSRASSLTTAGRSTSGGSSDTAALQKQLRDLTEQLKQAATDSTADSKAREQKVRLLQAQIQAVQAQIEAIQRRKQQEKTESTQDSTRQAGATDTVQSASSASSAGAQGSQGRNVDTCA